jgi:hypothetical protein
MVCRSVENYSKIGTYTGDRPNDVLVETGFEVGFVMIKAVDATDDWFIVDNKRGDNLLYANLANAETSFSGVSFLSNGFVLNGSQNSGGTNNSGTTFLYMAFAVDPDTEAPTLAKSFSTVTYDGTGANQSIEGLGFKPGFVWLKGRSRAEDSGLFDIVRGPNLWLRSSTNAAESDFSGNYGVLSFDDDGFSIGTGSAINNSGDTYVGWAWAADDNEPTIFGGAAKAVYKFEDNVNDVTGNYNGSATSITYNSSGNFNKSAEFNGSNSQITTSLAQSDTAAFTWSAWIKVHDFQGVNNVNVLGTMNPSSPYNGVAIFLDVASISLGEGGSNIGNIIASPSTNTWYHIVVAYDGSTFKCYVDGSLALTVTNSNTDGGNFWMGKGGPTSWTAFDGELDQVRVYNGAVSDIGVAALYAETVSQNDDLSLGGPPKSIVSANSNAGFSIIKYEGNGVAGAKIPHGLSAAPKWIIAKRLNSAQNWLVFHTSIGATKYLELNDSRAEDTATTVWNNTAPSATNVTLGTSSLGNGSGDDYIMYCFHDVTGYSKFGSYTGNGSTQSITGLGFQPDWLMIKQTNASNAWRIFDSVRGLSSPQTLYANLNYGEDSESNTVSSFDSDGFTMGSQQSVNDSGDTYIYMAFKIN